MCAGHVHVIPAMTLALKLGGLQVAMIMIMNELPFTISGYEYRLLGSLITLRVVAVYKFKKVQFEVSRKLILHA